MPGTIVGREAPEGWNHLVLKSIPKLTSGDIETLPAHAVESATLFRTVILADVQRDQQGIYALRKIGVGLCVPHQGQDTVVTTESLEQSGIRLSIVDQLVLDRALTELSKGRLIARTPFFALFEAPTMFANGGEHRKILLRYALIVDPETGRLQTSVWKIAADPSSRVPAQELVRLPRDLVFECRLDVSARSVLGSVPVSWSFAMTELPPGQRQRMPSPLRAWSVQTPRTRRENARLEMILRHSLMDDERRLASSQLESRSAQDDQTERAGRSDSQKD